MAMVVDDIHLPDELEQNAEIGLLFSTTLLPAANGIETTNQNWSLAKHQGTFATGVLEDTDVDAFVNFHAGRRGIARGFLFKNWFNYTMTRQTIATGNGVATVFPITRLFADSVNPYLHIITRPVISTLRVWKNNVEVFSPATWTFAPTTGLTFAVAPTNTHLIEVSCEFDLPMRFTEDYFSFNVVSEKIGSAKSFGIIEILEYLQT